MLNYNSPIKNEKSYSDLTVKEIYILGEIQWISN